MEPVLYIDGEPLELHFIHALAQADPSPGGHNFELRAPARWVEQRLWHTDLSFRDVPAEEGADMATWLHAVCSREDAADSPIKFLINKVTRIETLKGFIVFHGICSPVVRSNTD